MPECGLKEIFKFSFAYDGIFLPFSTAIQIFVDLATWVPTEAFISPFIRLMIVVVLDKNVEMYYQSTFPQQSKNFQTIKNYSWQKRITLS